MLLGIIHLLPHKKQIISLSVCIPVICVCVCMELGLNNLAQLFFKIHLLWGILVLFGKRVHDQINYIFFSSAFGSQRSFTYDDIVAFYVKSSGILKFLVDILKTVNI